MDSERTVTFQVLGKSLEQPLSESSWHYTGKDQEQAIVKQKKVNSRRYTLHRQSLGHLEGRGHQGVEVVSFYRDR